MWWRAGRRWAATGPWSQTRPGPTRLGFVLMLKFFELEDRFPQLVEELPPAAVDYVADVVKVSAEDLAKYDLSSRSAKGHRTQIREAFGFRPATRADEERLTAWLADEVCRWSWWRTGCARPCSCSAAATASSPQAASSRSWPQHGHDPTASSARRPSHAWARHAPTACWTWWRRTMRTAPHCWPR
ncbi:DUF4158 domain-containing protein [Streptomyces sp. NPDC051909]|uniref:DUF4158 domain-containing protein n=1 Tax=Streptomyces sp. NPDC051909 TaxID=3154944 RepID=UPI0034259B97